MTHLLPAQFSAWVFNGFQPAYQISVNKNIWLSASALVSHGPCSAALSSKMKTYKRLKTKIVKFQDPKRSFELFEFLIYSIPYLTKKSFFLQSTRFVQPWWQICFPIARPLYVCLSIGHPDLKVFESHFMLKARSSLICSHIKKSLNAKRKCQATWVIEFRDL